MHACTHQELNKAISTRERLRKIGLEKTSDLARFVEDFELVGFDANTDRKLTGWRRSLAEMGVEPDGLGDYIRERGTLEKERRRVGDNVKKLGKEHPRLFEETTSLQAEVPILKTRRFWEKLEEGEVYATKCRKCGRLYYPPQGDCVHCLMSDVEWVKLSKKAILETYSICMRFKDLLDSISINPTQSPQQEQGTEPA